MTLQKEFPDLLNRSGIFDLLVNYINQKSQVVNITAIRDVNAIWQKHIIDSLMFLRTATYKKFISSARDDNCTNDNRDGDNDRSLLTTRSFNFIDIGTGAGFPGLALAIALIDNLRGGCQFDLLDGTKKKLAVIDEFIRLANDSSLVDLTTSTKTIWGRAEELGVKKEFRAVYDIAFARSVSYIDKLIDYMLPFIKINGYLVIYKERSEVERADLLKIVKNHRLELVEEFNYELGDNKRVIYIIRKID